MITNSQLRRLADFELLRVVLAVALLMTGMPVVIAAVPVANAGPTLTVDICHPLQSLDHNPGPSPFARLAVHYLGHALVDQGSVTDEIVVPPAVLLEPPDPPPPKSLS